MRYLQRLLIYKKNQLKIPYYRPFKDFVPQDQDHLCKADAKGKMPSVSYQKLSEITLNQSVVMMGVSVHSPSFLQHLDKQQITLGCDLKVLEISDFDKSYSILLDGKTTIFVSNEVAKNLLVSIDEQAFSETLSDIVIRIIKQCLI